MFTLAAGVLSVCREGEALPVMNQATASTQAECTVMDDLNDVREPVPLTAVVQRLLEAVRLFRLPFLLTVPGDVLAGIAWVALADGTAVSFAQMGILAGCVFCLCAFGVILNDIHDAEADQKKHPSHPLITGAVTMPFAALAMILALGGAVALGLLAGQKVFLNVVLLAVLIAAYSLLPKEWPVLRPLVMGLCRALSFLLPLHISRWLGVPGFVALGLLLYVASVTLFVQRQEETWKHGWYAGLPAVILTLLSLALLGWCAARLGTLAFVLMAVTLLLAVLSTVWAGRRLARGPHTGNQTRLAAGTLVRVLLPVQASCLFVLPETLPYGFVLLAAWPLLEWLGLRADRVQEQRDAAIFEERTEEPDW